MNQMVCLIFLLSSFSYGQFTFHEPYQIQITSDVPYESLQTEIDQMRLSFEAQEWSVEILKYWLSEMQKAPFISGDQKINLIIHDSLKSRKIKIPIFVREKIVKAFKTEEGFQQHYMDFISDTYEWILRNL
tara:strand:+ start:12510 stop:12902 length:393 start_codon:yes stop_codon:yes gene_type:complete